MFNTARTLDGFATEFDNRIGAAINALEAGTTLVVKTQRSSYRVVVVDGPQRLVTVHGGVFPEPTQVRLCGATAGGSALRVGWIVVGLRMEFLVGSRRITTTPVRTLTIEPAVPGDAPYEYVA